MAKKNPTYQNLGKSEIANQTTCYVDIRTLKAFVSENFPKDSPIRIAILAELDTLDARELVGKIGTWLNLLRLI
jgi:hypothetical protein